MGAPLGGRGGGTSLCFWAGLAPTYHVCGQPLLNVLHEAGLGDGDLEGRQVGEAGGAVLGDKAQAPTRQGLPAFWPGLVTDP